MVRATSPCLLVGHSWSCGVQLPALSPSNFKIMRDEKDVYEPIARRGDVWVDDDGYADELEQSEEEPTDAGV